MDSGSYLVDPMNGKPVKLVKRDAIKLVRKYCDVLNSDDYSLKSRVRLIPAKGIGGEKIYVGLRCDYIKINNGKTIYKDIVVALDDEGGSLCGYPAIIPAAMAQD